MANIPLSPEVTAQAGALARLILTGGDEATRRALLVLALEQLLGVDDDADLGIQDAADALRADLDRQVSALLEECRDERLQDWTFATSEGMRLADAWRRERIAAENEAARQRVRARVLEGVAA